MADEVSTQQLLNRVRALKKPTPAQRLEPYSEFIFKAKEEGFSVYSIRRVLQEQGIRVGDKSLSNYIKNHVKS